MTRRFGEKDFAGVSRSLEMQANTVRVSKEYPSSGPVKALPTVSQNPPEQGGGQIEPEYQELRERNLRLERKVAELETDRDELLYYLHQTQRELERFALWKLDEIDKLKELNSAYKKIKEERKLLKDGFKDLKKENKQLKKKLKKLKSSERQIKKSLSWKITRPLRSIGRLLRSR